MENFRLITKPTILLSMVFIFYITDAFSQGRSQSAPGKAKSEAKKSKGKGTSVPIDGGAALLLAAGAAYGMKRIREKKVKESI
jgi:hypothetical protein